MYIEVTSEPNPLGGGSHNVKGKKHQDGRYKEKDGKTYVYDKREPVTWLFFRDLHLKLVFWQKICFSRSTPPYPPPQMRCDSQI